jgi:hypothetical protein
MQIYRCLDEVFVAPSDLVGSTRYQESQVHKSLMWMAPTQFFYIVVGVPVLSKGVQCSKICASEFCSFILYRVQLRSSMGTKTYSVHLAAAQAQCPPSCLSLLYLNWRPRPHSTAMPPLSSPCPHLSTAGERGAPPPDEPTLSRPRLVPCGSSSRPIGAPVNGSADLDLD